MKTYTVKQLATLAGVTVRALHHYDKIGLLEPMRGASNHYRLYSEKDLLKLQQIMFFRELELPLEQIKEILKDPRFEVGEALESHRKLIELKKKRMNSLLKTIDKTVKKINQKTTMNDEELYSGFSKEELEAWNKEAKERWGNTEAYKQSVGKYESLTQEEKLKLQKDGDALMKDIVANMDRKPGSPEVQALVQRHYDSLKFFYEPNLAMYRGLADMYVGYSGDKRFRTYFEKYDKNLPEFIREAIYIYCDKHEA